jgi:hypothetical protein
MAWHVTGLDEAGIPKQLLFAESWGGYTRAGRPKLRWLDCVTRDLAMLVLGTALYENDRMSHAMILTQSVVSVGEQPKS